jgi:IclR family transcriptional regulator, pca regulon regulatory protein
MSGGADVAGPAWRASLDEPRYSHSLERGLAILGCFTADRQVVGVAEIARELAMSRSTTHRYVSTLAALGYLEQDASRKYRLGLQVTDLGLSALSATGLREHAHPLLRELCQRTFYTASLGVLDRGEVLYVARVHSIRHTRHAAGLTLAVGSRVPAHASSMGKLLLASLSERERAELLGASTLSRLGPNTIVGRHALEIELEHIESEQFAVDDEELTAGVRSIAAPVRNAACEVVAAVTMEAPSLTISLEQLAHALGPHVLTTADHISARLGYRRGDETFRIRRLHSVSPA